MWRLCAGMEQHLLGKSICDLSVSVQGRNRYGI
jgi:hypothetical protein